LCAFAFAFEFEFEFENDGFVLLVTCKLCKRDGDGFGWGNGLLLVVVDEVEVERRGEAFSLRSPSLLSMLCWKEGNVELLIGFVVALLAGFSASKEESSVKGTVRNHQTAATTVTIQSIRRSCDHRTPPKCARRGLDDDMDIAGATMVKSLYYLY
jgi:hypothetical protein